MDARRGEKAGWISGWLGAFMWLPIYAVLMLCKGRILVGAAGLGLFAVAVFLVLTLSPWRHPSTRYWLLLLPVYALLAGCVAFAIQMYPRSVLEDVDWWTTGWLVLLFMPFLSVGSQRWRDRASDLAEAGDDEA